MADMMTPQAIFEAAIGYVHWLGVATFLRCPHRPNMSDTDIGIIGFPYSGGNMIERMQYLGPLAARNRSAGYRRFNRHFGHRPVFHLPHQ